MENTLAEISRNKDLFRDEIRVLRRRIEVTNNHLEVLQGLCPHPHIREYRGHQIGDCEYCGKVFLSQEDVDLLFSE